VYKKNKYTASASLLRFSRAREYNIIYTPLWVKTTMEFKKCVGCMFYSIDVECTASFYERVQSNCQENAESIRILLIRLDNLTYMVEGPMKDEQIQALNESLEALIPA
jgi:hypothetical protein